MTAFLFPGQGSQAPGMGKDFYENSPAAKAVLDQAASLAGDGFLATLFDGPAETLKKPDVAQPALIAVEVAIARHLVASGVEPAVCAGHSFGEFSALVAVDALDFEDAFKLAQKRGELTADPGVDGGMAAVLGMPADAIEAALPEGVEVANFNGPSQTIISGSREGLAKAGELLKEAGAKRLVPLPVGAPFHTSYLADAQRAFAEHVEQAAIRPPALRFVSSISGKEEGDCMAIRDLLKEQICRPVRWTDVMAALGPVAALEVGPGNVLQGIAKRTDNAPAVAPAGTLEQADAVAR